MTFNLQENRFFPRVGAFIRLNCHELPCSTFTVILCQQAYDTNSLLPLVRVFNTGSPYNVPAGSKVDLSEVRAHYQRKNAEMEEKQMAKLKASAGDSDVLAQRRATGSAPERTS